MHPFKVIESMLLLGDDAIRTKQCNKNWTVVKYRGGLNGILCSIYASSEGSGDSVPWHRLAWVFFAVLNSQALVRICVSFILIKCNSCQTELLLSIHAWI